MGFLGLTGRAALRVHRSVQRCFSDEVQELLPELRDTEVLLDLLRYPPKERVESWTTHFYHSLGTASLKGWLLLPSIFTHSLGSAGDIQPQVILGPDRMPYFRLAVPHYGEPFESYSFSNPKFLSFCLDGGIGAVIFNNPNAAEKAEFDDFEKGSFHAITFGQIASYHRYQSFFGDPKDIFEIQNGKVHPLIASQEQWHGGIVPPESGYLPHVIRSHLKLYIETITDGLRLPRVAMKVDPEMPKVGKPSRVLTFNYSVEDFENGQSEAAAFVECLQWFLPPSMSVSLLQSKRHLEFAETDPESPFIPITSHDEYSQIE